MVKLCRPKAGGSPSQDNMEYIRQHKEYGITNVLLMDDDVDFYMESFYNVCIISFEKK